MHFLKGKDSFYNHFFPTETPHRGTKINCQLAKVYKNNFKIQYLSLRIHYTLSKMLLF